MAGVLIALTGVVAGCSDSKQATPPSAARETVPIPTYPPTTAAPVVSATTTVVATTTISAPSTTVDTVPSSFDSINGLVPASAEERDRLLAARDLYRALIDVLVTDGVTEGELTNTFAGLELAKVRKVLARRQQLSEVGRRGTFSTTQFEKYTIRDLNSFVVVVCYSDNGSVVKTNFTEDATDDVVAISDVLGGSRAEVGFVYTDKWRVVTHKTIEQFQGNKCTG